MKHTEKKGLLASVAALGTAIALALSGSTAALAAPVQPAPESSTVTITKLEQPATVGDAATGLPITGDLPSDYINGVVFEYYLVPGTEQGGAHDIGTNVGQQWAAGQTVADFDELLEGEATGSFDATAGNGVTSEILQRGLYVIKEASAPAGVVPAVPFLLSVPLTNPENRNAWLDEIFVYPKNAKIEAVKTADNAGDYVVGSTVTWTIDSAAPRIPNPAGSPAFLATDKFEIHDTLTDAELTTTVEGVNVTSPAGLVKGPEAGADYDVALNSADGETTVRIVFTEAGRAKLAAAVNEDADARVTATIDTVVNASGVITNQAQIIPGEGAEPLVTEAAEIRYGNFRIQKLSTDESATAAELAGAEFRVYLSREDAEENDSERSLKPASNTAGVWTTEEGGQLLIEGLRDSDFANGADRLVGNDGFQSYWLVEIKALDDHQLLAEPIEFTVNQTTGTADEADLDVTNVKNGAGFVLPLTGGTGTLFLTIGGIALLAIVLVVARRRRNAVDA